MLSTEGYSRAFHSLLSKKPKKVNNELSGSVNQPGCRGVNAPEIVFWWWIVELEKRTQREAAGFRPVSILTAFRIGAFF